MSSKKARGRKKVNTESENTRKKEDGSGLNVLEDLSPHRCAEYLLDGGPLTGHIADKLIEMGEEQARVYILYMLCRVHGVKSGKSDSDDATMALVNEIIKQEEIKEVLPAGTNYYTERKKKDRTVVARHFEKFMEVFLTSAIGSRDFEIVEGVLKPLFFLSILKIRPLRFLGTQSSLLALPILTAAWAPRESQLEELRGRRHKEDKKKISQIKEQTEWLCKISKQLLSQILLQRATDIMNEIRNLVADCILEMIERSVLHLLLRKKLAHCIGQLVFDQNKQVKKRGLLLASKIISVARESGASTEMQNAIKEYINIIYEEKHKAKIIYIALTDTGSLAAMAVRALYSMQKNGMLTESEEKFTARLLFRKKTKVAREAAKFVVKVLGHGKIIRMEYGLKEDKTVFDYSDSDALQSVEVLANLLKDSLEGLEFRIKRKAVQDALDILQHETLSVFDIRSMCQLLMRGEKEFAGESKADEALLDILSFMLRTSARILSKLRHEILGKSEHDIFIKKCVESMDRHLLNFLPKLLSIHKHHERIGSIIKSISWIRSESFNSSEDSQKQTEKIYSKILSIFRISQDLSVCKTGLKILKTLEKADNNLSRESGKLFELMLREFKEKLKTEFLNSKSSLISKLGLLCAALDAERIKSFTETILPDLSNLLLEERPLDQESIDNLTNIYHALFVICSKAYTLGISDKLESEILEKIREESIVIMVSSLKNHEECYELSLKCFFSLCNLLIVSSNDSAKETYFYDIDKVVLAALTDYFLGYIHVVFENEKEITNSKIAPTEDMAQILEINHTIQILILSCETIFHSELAVMYLAIFGSNRKNLPLTLSVRRFLRKLYNRCVVYKGKSIYYMYIKEALVECFNFPFKCVEEQAEELKKRAEPFNLSFRQYYSLQRTKDLMQIIADEAEHEDEGEVQPEAFTKEDLYNNFLLDLLKESLKMETHFPLLEAVLLGITSKCFPKEKLGWLYQLFEALSQHILRIDKEITETSQQHLKDFKNSLYQKVAAKKILRTPVGRAIVSSTSKKSNIIPAIIEEESGGDSARKKRPSSHIRKNKSSTRKKIDLEDSIVD